MKTSIYILLFMFIMNIKSIGQRATKQEGISNTTSIRGKKLLRKENRIHNATENLAVRNENKARKKHKLGTLSNYNSQKKMVNRERKKAKKEKAKEEKQSIKKEKGKKEIITRKETEGKKETVVATMGPEDTKE
ncbi:MAG: hypothetical protein K0S53_468 [Bacteroidetes bacterium]|nr:hypothetical protein [Bacteroidota bacterium]MDF2452886.1 hypothetical protein [Bacteroidota bacterium]